MPQERRALAEQPGLLGVYLNDHLATATGGVELARRAASGTRDRSLALPLQELADELAIDHQAMRDTMVLLDLAVRRYKTYTAWAAEKVGRLKPNGRLLRRSPLSTLVEVEGLIVVVAHAGACWRTLRQLAEHEQRLDPQVLDARVAASIQRAARTAELHGRAVERLTTTGG